MTSGRRRYASRNPLPMPSRRSRLGWTTNRQPDEVLFAGDDLADLRARWAGVQAAFVDDPKDCVQKADALVSDLVEQLTTGFAQARSRLEDQWSRGEEASTEDLRAGFDALPRILRPLARRLTRLYHNSIRLSSPYELHAVAGQPGIEVVAVAGQTVDGVHCAPHGLLGDLWRQQAVPNRLQQFVDVGSQPPRRRCGPRDRGSGLRSSTRPDRVCIRRRRGSSRGRVRGRG